MPARPRVWLESPGMRLLPTLLVSCCLGLAACSPPPESELDEGTLTEGSDPISQPTPPSEKIPGRYIVVLKEPAPGEMAVSTHEHAQRLTTSFGGTVVSVYTVIRGFAVKDLPELNAHALGMDPAVKYVEQDTVVRVDAYAADVP